MRIGIDVRYLSHGLVGGVHSYVSQIVPELLLLAPDHQLFLYADSKRPFEIAEAADSATVRILPWRDALSSVQHDFTLQRVMARDGLDVVHFPANYGFGPRGVPSVITLHDAINVLPLAEIVRGHPKQPRVLATMTYLHVCSTLSLRRASLVLTVSQQAAREIVHYGKLDPARIVAIPHGRASDLRRVTEVDALDRVRARYGLPRSFVLADALKNPTALIEAWRLLPAELRMDRQIVFFSRKPDPSHVVFEAVAAGEARLLVRVSREDLIALYSTAEAFVFPSWIEGFGIPLLEAMTCGAPIVASNRGSIPEVLGDAGLLVDVEDVQGLATCLSRVLTSADLRASLRERGFTRAGQFSWQSTAAQILRGYERAIATGSVRATPHSRAA
jgi:glycosyltransferase involved in cell wall biosynthesis